MSTAPVPRFDLIDMSEYHSMCLQFSRGCPFDCEFCDITKLYGRVSRTKSPEQMVAEFDRLYELGWRGPLFLVDDNFIGNKREVSRLLPVIAEWQKERGHPYALFTEASVNLVRMNDLMDDMIEAGFDAVFLGIETPNPKALKKMKKPQNLDMRDENYLFTSVRKIQEKGMMVLGGFILGLDDDDDNAFDAQIEFVQEAGIPIALVGLLTALKGTNLWTRLERENRLLDKPVEIDATALNFKPQMDPRTLVEGYLRVVGTIYDSTLENYFDRCLTLLDNLNPVPHIYKPVSKHILYLGIMGIRRRLTPNQLPVFSRYIARVSRDHPRLLPLAIRLAAMGYHCEKLTRQQTVLREFKAYLDSELASFSEAGRGSDAAPGAVDRVRQEALRRADARQALHPRGIPPCRGRGLRESDGIPARPEFRGAAGRAGQWQPAGHGIVRPFQPFQRGTGWPDMGFSYRQLPTRHRLHEQDRVPLPHRCIPSVRSLHRRVDAPGGRAGEPARVRPVVKAQHMAPQVARLVEEVAPEPSARARSGRRRPPAAIRRTPSARGRPR